MPEMQVHHKITPLAPPHPSTSGFTAKFFRGLGDPTRVRILELLTEKERTVGELVDELGGFQGRISSHLSCLRWCGLVTARREGRNVYYRLANRRIARLLELAEEFVAQNGEWVEMYGLSD